ncbi:MAG: electron transfer flavoprotein subunit alpha/FixB family protein [Acidimicrobiia bacterium]
MGRVLLYAEATGGRPTSTTLELASKGRALADTVEAFYAGPDAESLAGPLGEHGVSRLYVLPIADVLPAAPAAAALAALVGDEPPDAVLFATSYDGRDVAGRLSARLDVPVLSNGSALAIDGGAVRVSNAIFGGNTIVETAARDHRPAIALLRPKSFVIEASGGGPAEIVEVAAPESGVSGARVLDRYVQEQEGPRLEDAAVVVSGGRGLGGAEHFGLVDQLAKLLGGAAGASRAIVDAGWVPYSHQVGQTGKTVKPRLYIALGISGATQHMVGMKSSDNIIAINKDAEAPIFSVADLGIVGDVHKVVPKLIEALEARRG